MFTIVNLSLFTIICLTTIITYAPKSNFMFGISGPNKSFKYFYIKYEVAGILPRDRMPAYYAEGTGHWVQLPALGIV